MRKAIKSTNVVLNLSILPGVILVPSNMIILDRPIAGYNNVLTTATEKMKFGVNQKLNYSPPPPTTLPNPTIPSMRKEDEAKEKGSPPKSLPIKTHLNKEHQSNLNYVFGTVLAVGGVLAKLLL